jgi:hypothetical protein
MLTTKTIDQGGIAAHGPPQTAQALLPSEPKLKDKRPSLLALLRFVRPLSVSPEPCDVIQAPEPCDVIEALDPHYNTLPQGPTLSY